MQEQRDDIFCILQTGNVKILDLAGGSGAGVIGIVSTLVHLRFEGSYPSLPLNLEVHAADFSGDALLVYEKMIQKLSATYARYGVKIALHKHVWDASDVSRTSQICDACVSTAGGYYVIVLVSNLSGIGKTTLESLVRSFQHVNERIASNSFPWYWIEPGNVGGTDFLRKVKKAIFDTAAWARRKTSLTSEFSYDWWHELQTENKRLPGSISILKYDK